MMIATPDLVHPISHFGCGLEFQQPAIMTEALSVLYVPIHLLSNNEKRIIMSSMTLVM